MFRHQSGTAWEPEALSRTESWHSVAIATGMHASKCMPGDVDLEMSESEMSPKQVVFCNSVGAGIVVLGHMNCKYVHTVAYKVIRLHSRVLFTSVRNLKAVHQQVSFGCDMPLQDVYTCMMQATAIPKRFH
jgi:hypothetical protein